MTVRPRIKGVGDRKEGRIKNRLNWFVVTEMKGRRKSGGGGSGRRECFDRGLSGFWHGDNESHLPCTVIYRRLGSQTKDQ